MKLVVWLLLAALLLGAAFCASTCRREGAQGRIELTLFDWTDADYNRMNLARIALFEKENPDIKVRLVTGGQDKYLTMVVGRVAPDVTYAAYQHIPYYAKRGAILPLDEFIAGDDFSLETFFPASVKSMRYRDGKIYGLPDSGSAVALFYNKDMFDRYNNNRDSGSPRLDYPSSKWDWADFRRAAKALTRDTDGDGRTDEYGASVGFSYNRFPIYVWQNGGEVISADKKRCLMDSPEAIGAIRWLYQLMWVDKSVPTASTQIEGASQQSSGIYFKEQRLAMMMTTRWGYLDLIGKTDFNWDVAPLPHRRGNRTTIYIGGGWLISSQTHYPEKAWRLAKFLVSDVSSEMTMECGRALTCNKAVAESMTTDEKIRRKLRAPPNDHMWVETMYDCRPKDFHIAEMGRFFTKAADELSYITQGRHKPRRMPEEACRNFTRHYNEGLRILWKEEGGP